MKHLIWDLDGTLIDSYPVILTNLYNTMEQFDKKIDEVAIYQFITEYSIKEYFIKESKRLSVDVEELKSIYMAEQRGVQIEEYEMIENASEVINSLNELGCVNYIYTHRDDLTYDMLEHHGFLKSFKDIVISNHGLKRKPEPDGVLYLIEKYNLDKEEVVYVGDRSLDIECGNNAGVKTVYYNPMGDEQETATYNVDSLNSIIELVK